MIPILKQFGGGRAPEYLSLSRLTDSNLTFELDQGSPASPYKPRVSLRLNQDGRLQIATGTTESALVYSTKTPDWLAGGSVGDLYETQLTVNSGGTGGGITGSATGSYLALTDNRVWTFDKDTNSLGTVSWDIDVVVREIADPSGNIVTNAGLTVFLQIAL